MLDAIRAVETAGIGAREDFYWTLHAVFVTRREHHLVFDQAFRVFWRKRQMLEKMLAMLSPNAPARPERRGPPPLKRVEDAFFAGVGEPRTEEKHAHRGRDAARRLHRGGAPQVSPRWYRIVAGLSCRTRAAPGSPDYSVPRHTRAPSGSG